MSYSRCPRCARGVQQHWRGNDELSSTGVSAASPRYVNCVDEINSVQFVYIEGVTTKLEGVTTKLLPFFDAG